MTADAGEARLTWRVHPAAERPALTVIVSLLILAVALLAAAWMRGLYWGGFALLVLFLSLESYFLPTRYTVDAAGVRVTKIFSRVERPWNAFRGAWFDRVGVTLSPYSRRHWLEPYRALRVRWGAPGAAPDRCEVVALLLAHLDASRVAIAGLERGRAGGEPCGHDAPPGACGG